MKNIFQKIKDTIMVGLIYSSIVVPSLVSANNGDVNQYVNGVFSTLGVSQNDGAGTKESILEKIGSWIPFAMGIAASILVIIAIVRGVSLAMSGDSPQKRSEGLRGVLFLVLGAAVVGGAALLVSLAYGLFR